MQHCIIRFIIFCFCLIATTVWGAVPLNMPVGVTPISQDVYDLHMAGFYVCCVIGIIVFGVLIYSLVKYRKSKGAKAAHFHEHLGIEIIWTTIPFLILVGLAIPATLVLAKIHNTSESALTIKVTGYQWKWKYEYLDQGIRFFSTLTTSLDQINGKMPKNEWYLLEVDNPMVVPVNTKVNLLITADDVIHSWWVPDLGIKQDAIPGYINENWIFVTQPGVYRGQCGELCGANHAFMPIVVKAVPQEEFNQWVISNRNMAPISLAPMKESELLALGKTEYEKNCAMCHQNTGLGLPPTFPPLKKSRVTTGPVNADVSFVLTGVPGTAMQAFADQLDDRTLAAIITYTRQSWGNDEINKRHNQPTVVQPLDVENARQSNKK